MSGYPTNQALEKGQEIRGMMLANERRKKIKQRLAIVGAGRGPRFPGKE